MLINLVGNEYSILKEKINDEIYLRTILLNSLQYIIEDEKVAISNVEDFFNYLTLLSISQSEKWKIFTIYMDPIKYFKQLIDLIDLNLDLCIKLYQKFKISNLINNTTKTIENDNHSSLLKGLDNQKSNIEITFSFMYPLSILGNNDKTIYGLFNYDLLSNEINNQILMI